MVIHSFYFLVLISRNTFVHILQKKDKKIDCICEGNLLAGFYYKCIFCIIIDYLIQ